MGNDIVKPFLRWAGGKRWILSYLDRIVDIDIYNAYHEPFIGGGSVFFELNPQCETYISDSNQDLINAYTCVKQCLDDVWSLLNEYENTEEDYYRIRALDPIDPVERAARFIYLNHTSFNGLYRVNREGKYNVPYGKRKVVDYNFDNLSAASSRLNNAHINFMDFEEALQGVKKNDLVYLDPPYVVAKDNNCFIQYNKNLFALEDQKRLSKCIDKIKSVGAFYILSNAKHDTIFDIFQKDGDSVITLTRSSLIGGKNAYRGKTEEYLFTNIPDAKLKLENYR